ncbi:MAG: nitroreductase family protein, partial [Halieaceae bacterium]
MSETSQTFLDIVKSRRSMREFKSDPVPDSVIEAVFGTAQRAPSNCNTQPWFVHVVTGDT